MLKIYGDLIVPELYIEYLNGEYNHPDLAINGCGPAGILNTLVPDTYKGIDLNEACDIHDFMYFHGKTEQDKDLADRIFLFNLLTIFDRDDPSRKISKKRHRKAISYYNAASELGHYFFTYKGCERPVYDDSLKEVIQDGYEEKMNIGHDWYDEHDGG